MKKSTQQTTLTSYIRKKISARILMSMLLILFGIVLLTAYDVMNSISALKKELHDYSQPLEDFVIGQVLVPSHEVIQLKLKEFKAEHSVLSIDWIQDKPTAGLKERLVGSLPFSWTYYYPLRTINDTGFGYFEISGSFLHDRDLVLKLGLRVVVFLSFYLLLFLILNPLSKSIPKSVFIDPIHHLLSMLKKNDKSLFGSNGSFSGIQELNEIKDEIISLFRQIETNANQVALGKLATQVVHDIRSPLAVLNVMTKDLHGLPEDERGLMREATSRINDIANNLIASYKESNHIQHSDTQCTQPQLISALLGSMISEKRIVLEQSNIKIIEEFDERSCASFSMVSAVEFKRIASNMMNNSIEAIQKTGIISVKINSTRDSINVSIQDNGAGIPHQIIPNLTERGFTYGKSNGSGLGLHHAKQCINAWGGTIEITSKMNHGTTVEIVLPRCNAPEWFAESIKIAPHSQIIIVDDDESIHRIWKKRFDALQNTQPGARFDIHDFYCFDDYLKSNSVHKSAESKLFLIDYEFVGQEKNGLEYIGELKLKPNIFLVTGRYDDAAVQSQAIDLGIKIIPKYYSIYVPMVFC